MQNWKIVHFSNFNSRDGKNVLVSVDTTEEELGQMIGLKSKILEKWITE